ncbi:hypothetical protein [Pedobacter insulae]|uniref:Zinc-finger n=1 Tax=Pedobacter insulae TaxID=414048 RepID=A0A1I2Y2P2_9SPHI|nr:hypothetical protein [Pedobacter insulae]SFH19933.1 hypothetical protein SAMN04489864_106188 [Pedobacter insulae]
MKELSKTDLTKIAYDCRKATFLIEKQQIYKITLREKMELKLHLTGCSICVTFMKQSAIINQMARKLVNADSNALKLDEGFKAQLQKQVDNYLNKI